MEFPAWAKDITEVSAHFKVDTSTGLSQAEVNKRRIQHGFNELKKEPGTPLWKLILAQFDDMLVKVPLIQLFNFKLKLKVLLMAALVSLILAYFEESNEEGIQAFIEPFVIMLILIINAIVGVWQESNAEAALDALKEMQSEYCKVIRNGKRVEFK